MWKLYCKRLMREEKGSVLTEYGLFIGIVVVGCIAIIYELRDSIIDLLQSIIDAITL